MQFKGWRQEGAKAGGHQLTAASRLPWKRLLLGRCQQGRGFRAGDGERAGGPWVSQGSAPDTLRGQSIFPMKR